MKNFKRYIFCNIFLLLFITFFYSESTFNNEDENNESVDNFIEVGKSARGLVKPPYGDWPDDTLMWVPGSGNLINNSGGELINNIPTNTGPSAEEIKNEKDRAAADEMVKLLESFRLSYSNDFESVLKKGRETIISNSCAEKEKLFYSNLYPGEKEIVDKYPEIKSAMMCGDPVQIVTGKFYSTNIDHTSDCVFDEFSIKREYLTGKDSGIAFGKNWSSFLDSRIIRGRSDSMEKIINEINAKIASESKNQNKYGNYSYRVNNKVKELQEYVHSKSSKYQASISASIYNKYSLTPEYNYMNDVGTDYLCFIDDSGNPIFFKYDSNKNIYVPENNDFKNRMIITSQNGNFESGYIIRTFTDEERRYTKWGFLESIKTVNGHEINFTAKEIPNQISTIYFDNKKIYEIYWTQEKVSKIYSCLDDLNFYYEYLFDNLVSCLSKNNAKKYFYDNNDNLISNVENKEVVNIKYGKTSDGFVVLSVSNNFGEEKFNYISSEKIMEYINADGEKTTYFFNNDLVYKEKYCDGTEIIKEYKNGYVSSVKDKYGIKKYSYDDYGVLTSCTYDNGSYEKWNYNPSNHKLISYKDRDGILTEFVYDSNGNIINIKRSGKTVYSATYNSLGVVTSYSGLGSVDEFSYDLNNNVVSRRGMKSEYDENNRLVKCVDSSGNVANYNWSEDLSILNVIINQRLSIEYKFDEINNISSITETDLKTNETYYVQYERDLKGRVLRKNIGHGKSVFDAKNNKFLKESYEYSPQGKLKSCTTYNSGISVKNDGYGLRHEYSYINGNLSKYTIYYIDQNETVIGNKYETDISRTYVNGIEILTEIKPDGFSIKTYSNRNGDVLKIQKGTMYLSQYEYTDSGKIKTYQTSYGGKYSYSYDPVSLQISSVRKGNSILEGYEYDLFGNVSKVIYADGSSTNYKYMYGENKWSILEENPNGKKIYEYDLNGNLLSKSYIELNGTLLNFSGNNTNDYVQKYGVSSSMFSKNYDAWKRTIYDSLNDAYFEYDSYGYVSAIWRKSEKTKITYEYNLFGKVSREISETGVKTDFKYDVNGNLIEQKENGKLTWQGDYDSNGNLLNEKSPVFGLKEYFYDDLGFIKLVKHNGIVQLKNVRKDNLKTVIHEDANGNIWTDYYNEYGEGIKSINRYGNEKNQSYDERKNQLIIKDYSGNQTMYHMSTNDSLLTISTQSGLVNKVLLNSMGDVKSIVSNKKGGQSFKTEYIYGKNNELLKSEVSFSNSNSYSLSMMYDKNGYKNMIFSNGNKIEYQRDSFGNITNIKSSRGNNNLNIAISYDDYGREILRQYSDNIFEKKEYDDFSRITFLSQENKKTEEKQSILNIYDDWGRLQYEIFNGETFNYYEYDSFGRISKFISYASNYLIENKKEIFNQYGIDFNFNGGEKCSIKTSSFKELSEQLYSKGYSQKILYSPQNSFVEEYKYDLSGNRKETITSAGTIRFQYDKENRLISVSGNKSTKYIYDLDGRLIKETSTDKVCLYSYDELGNLISSQYIDLNSGISLLKKYEYDALGRQIRVYDSTGNDVLYLYDGTSRQIFATVLNESMVSEIGSWKYDGSNVTENEKKQNNKYRYMNSETFETYREENEFPMNKFSETNENSENRYSSSVSNEIKLLAPKMESNMMIYNRGNLIARIGIKDFASFSNDMTGNIKSVFSSSEGNMYLLNYDVSGNILGLSVSGKKISSSELYKLTSGFMYKGMEYDSVSGTYNNYRRRYNSLMNSFTTCDPIMDGINWYSYCRGDGVNFYDNGGTTVDSPKILKTMTYWGVSGTTDRVLLGNSKSEHIDDYGCFLCLVCGVVNTLYDSTLEMTEMNSVKKYFGDANTNYAGEMNTQTVLERYNITQETNVRPKTNGITDPKKIAEVNNNYNKKVKDVITAAVTSDTEYVVGLQVHLSGVNPRTGVKSECDHFVATDGTFKEIDEKSYIKVIGTSDNDKSSSWLRTDWKEVKDGESTNYYVPVDKVNDVRLYSKLCDNN